MFQPVDLLASGVSTALDLKDLRGLLARMLDPNTPRFLEARAELYRSWVPELAACLAAQGAKLEELTKQNADLRAEVARQLPVTARILQRYAEEASREPIDERRRMLAYAAAATFDPRTSEAKKARIERVIQELDPDDVLHLAFRCDVLAVDDLPFTGTDEDDLIAAGCMQVGPTGFGGGRGMNSVTQRGRDVVAILEDYVRVRAAEARQTRPATATALEPG